MALAFRPKDVPSASVAPNLAFVESDGANVNSAIQSLRQTNSSSPCGTHTQMLRVISSGPTKTVDLGKASGGPPSLFDTCSGVNCAGRPEGAQGHARSHCPF